MNARVISKNLPITDIDYMLMDVVIRIQLPPTSYKLATQRYKTIQDYLERDGSPLKGCIARMYPQGSMAIGATIASKVVNDEFDIDVIVELKSPTEANPTKVLDSLFQAMNGDKDSRYHGKVERMTRCVQVQYENMHMDLTPAELLPAGSPRTSHIYHSKVDRSPRLERRLVANPWGLADWFNKNTAYNADFARLYRERLNPGKQLLKLTEATADPVPAQHDPKLTSTTVLALQLVKRWRNLLYALKPEGRRKPTSVVLARLAVGSEAIPYSLYSELLRQTTKLHDTFNAAQSMGQVVHITNPTCMTDILTDRWPGNLEVQREFISELREFIADLRALPNADIEDQQEILSRLFGETPAKEAIRSFTDSRMARAQATTFTAPAPPHCQVPTWPTAYSGNVSVEGRYYNKNNQPMSMKYTGHILPVGKRLEFNAKTDIQPPYQTYWQVVNTGAYAKAANGLRGNFEKSPAVNERGLTKMESTLYRGEHWIECFIIKGNYLVARSGRYAVIIK